jgi:hypothetical protein
MCMDDKEILRRVIKGFELIPARQGFGHPYVTKSGAATPDLAKRINVWIKQNFPQSNIIASYEGVYKTINFRRAVNEDTIKLSNTSPEMTSTTKQFIEKARKEWGDRYDYSLVDYKNNNTPVKILCNNPEHRKEQKKVTGEEYFLQTPRGHLQGHEGCPQHNRERTAPKGETLLLQTLSELGYEEGKDYKVQYPYPGLTGEATKRGLTADTYLPSLDTIIEYDGEFHFKPGRFSNSEEKFRKQVMYDRLKNAYCKENGITLIRIPYTMRKSEQLLKPLQNAIKNRKPGEIVLLGNYPKAGWNA